MSIQALENRNLLAATFNVDVPTDTIDVNHGDGVCADATGSCSLRAAIEESNALAGVDQIHFDLDLATADTIIPSSLLPALTEAVVIDATTQAGYVGAPVVGISGGSAGSGADGLRIRNSGSTVKGLSIHGFSSDGIDVVGGGDHSIQENFIGLDLDGNAAGNFHGVKIVNASGITIDSNTISGNNRAGVFINSTLTQGNTFTNNRIGTDPAGASAVPNATDGLTIKGGNNQIGTLENGNLISGNRRWGVFTDSVGRGGNVIQGNTIGLDAAGENALPNVIGLHIRNEDNVIGGTEVGQGNIISGNSAFGVAMNSVSATGNVVFGNRIGTDESGAQGFGTTLVGVRFTLASGNTVGGLENGQGNIISGNAGSGFLFAFSGTENNQVVGNRIGTNIAGDTAVPNGQDGVRFVQGASENLIHFNQISGNNGRGVSTDGFTTVGNDITSNLIGTDATGLDPLHNGAGGGVRLLAPGSVVADNTISSPDHGILAFRNAVDLVIKDNLIAQSQSGINFTTGARNASVTGNTITQNTSGIVVTRATEISILSNEIFGNTSIGIDLNSDGVSTNDAVDRDAGANNTQNTPEISQITRSGGNITVTYRVNSGLSFSNYDLEIQFFVSDGSGQGARLLTSDTYPQSQQRASRTVTLPVSQLAVGDKIVATATDEDGNTSEFSAEFSPAIQATAVWTGASSQAWSDSGNWQSGQVPSVNDDVLIDLAGERVDINQDIQVRSLYVENSGADAELRALGFDVDVTSELSLASNVEMSSFGVVTSPNGFIPVLAGGVTVAGDVTIGKVGSALGFGTSFGSLNLLGNATVLGGTVVGVSGPGNLTLGGTAEIRGILNGTGSVAVESGAQVTLGDADIQQTFVNSGVLKAPGGVGIQWDLQNVDFINNGTVLADSLRIEGNGKFINNGSFFVRPTPEEEILPGNSSSATLRSQVPFDNHGLLSVQSADGFHFAILEDDGVHTGRFLTKPDALLRFEGTHTFQNPGDFGEGIVSASAADLIINGSASIKNYDPLNSATIDNRGTVTIENAEFDLVSFDGPGLFIFTGRVVARRANWLGNGRNVFTSSSVTSFVDDQFIEGRNFANDGVMVWSSPINFARDETFFDSSFINNGRITIQGSGFFRGNGREGVAPTDFINNGQIIKRGTSTFRFFVNEVDFQNSGSLSVLEGTLIFSTNGVFQSISA